MLASLSISDCVDFEPRAITRTHESNVFCPFVQRLAETIASGSVSTLMARSSTRLFGRIFRRLSSDNLLPSRLDDPFICTVTGRRGWSNC